MNAVTTDTQTPAMVAKPISEGLSAKEAARLTPDLSSKMQLALQTEEVEEGGT